MRDKITHLKFLHALYDEIDAQIRQYKENKKAQKHIRKALFLLDPNEELIEHYSFFKRNEMMELILSIVNGSSGISAKDIILQLISIAKTKDSSSDVSDQEIKSRIDAKARSTLHYLKRKGLITSKTDQNRETKWHGLVNRIVQF